MGASERQNSGKKSRGKTGCFVAIGCGAVLLGLMVIVMLVGYLIFGVFIDEMIFSYSPYVPDFYYYISLKRIEFLHSLENLF
ncbi:hypothetical protein [Desmospora activa]|uniref:Uncharacterized protein n=1 Tax=Desmospora activa DSM 45169 TaxID=1121389 RepID=A0A2T4Z6S9_9BACL|nr:hypothetical protein [Desmospora activa]PTM57581.1 hypothetical protein C8J48_0130 [Desmospora activa DSM 45169]